MIAMSKNAYEGEVVHECMGHYDIASRSEDMWARMLQNSSLSIAAV